jgi:hypothetical protein
VAQGGRDQGAELDHTALRWILLALRDPNDFELFVKALHALLQSDSGTGFTRDGGRVAQALFFGPDMLATSIVRLLHSAIPSDMFALAPADRRRFETRTATCLSIASLLARACDGPTPSAYHLWGAWAVPYSNPVCAMRLPSASIHNRPSPLSHTAQPSSSHGAHSSPTAHFSQIFCNAQTGPKRLHPPNRID